MYHEIILLGVLISLVYTELTGYSAGLVVPGYLALSLHAPSRIFLTFIIAAVAVLICKGASKWLIVYGRRRFALLLFVSFLLSWGMGYIPLSVVTGGVIGTLIPGLIARDMDRQGMAVSIMSTVIVTGLVSLVLLGFRYPVFGR